MFAAFEKTASSTLEAHFRPKKSKTILMSQPVDLDDADTDDDADVRPTKLNLSGMVVPYLVTSKGNVILGF